MVGTVFSPVLYGLLGRFNESGVSIFTDRFHMIRFKEQCIGRTTQTIPSQENKKNIFTVF